MSALRQRLEPALAAPDPRAAAVAVLREAWEAGRARARARLEARGKGLEVARLYAATADEVVTALWDFAVRLHAPADGAAPRLALLAVGGYGRGVLAPHSDLDLLFLRAGKAGAGAEPLVEFVLHALWDLGPKVGWAVRGMDETLKLARRDMTVRTALLEARPLAGDPALAARLLDRFRREVARSDPRPFIEAKLAERDLRHQKAGAVRYRVEPNVKDGKGGMRDLNTLFWIARALAPDSHLGARALEGLLTARERRTFEQAFDFLWAVRAHMHLSAGRAEEKLTFDLQPEVARRMGWSGRGEEPAVERFMRRYFLVARDVGALTRALCAKLEAQHRKAAGGLMRLLPLGRRTRHRPLAVEGFVEQEGRLSVAGPGVFVDDPVKLLLLFREADRLDLDLHPDAFAAVSRALDLVTPRLRRHPEAARAFLDVLARGRRPYRALTLMNETGLLGRFLPEFARVVGQTQFNMYHAYTVDEHTLQAIGVLNDIENGKLVEDHPLTSQVIKLIGDREALYLAMLLHDVGKGGARGQLEDGAIAARRACERLGLRPAQTEMVAWLVRHHLVLSDYAQKRDVSDPGTVEAFAAVVGEPERLRLLLALTVADIRAVGPGVWNGWKGQLIRELYDATGRVFRGERLAEADPAARHPAIVARAAAAGAAASLIVRPHLNAAELVLGARDRQGLFADVAAALAAGGANVIGARLNTIAGDLALDVFYLQDRAGRPFGQAHPPEGRALRRAVEAAARGEGGAPAVPATPASRRRAVFEVSAVVAFDNDASTEATIVEASGPDRPGLLADLARVLADAGLQVRSAHIQNYGERAVDAFYVSDATGAKLTDPDGRERLRANLLEVLDDAPVAIGPRPLARARASAAR